jgi:phosphate transport system substrate-binding protein
MRRIIIGGLALAVFALSGCTFRLNVVNSPAPVYPAEPIYPVMLNEPSYPVIEEYPIIDGSTSTVEMHAAIVKAFIGEEVYPTHSRTYEALERLAPDSDNPADIVLAVKYYDETLEEMADRGAKLVITPIAKEGFVFVTTKDNPIDSLTVDELRKIYSGEITNWSQLGGQDKEIEAFQRNEDSGSQTAMLDFMGDIQIREMTPVVSAMSDMLHEVQAKGGLGYSIFSWALQTQFNYFENLKMIAIEGITPSYNTIADESYPAVVYTYSYYNAGNANGKALTQWLLTDEGQRLIAEAGYISLDGIVPSTLTQDAVYSALSTQDSVYVMYGSKIYRFDSEYGYNYAMDFVYLAGGWTELATEPETGSVLYSVRVEDGYVMTVYDNAIVEVRNDDAGPRNEKAAYYEADYYGEAVPDLDLQTESYWEQGTLVTDGSITAADFMK